MAVKKWKPRLKEIKFGSGSSGEHLGINKTLDKFGEEPVDFFLKKWM